MKKVLLATLLLGLLAVSLPAAEVQPVPEPKTTGFQLPDGTFVRTVPPAQLKVKGAKKFALAAEPLKLPPAPTTFDYAKDKSGKSIPFPMHGNDRYGDCFYVAPIHMTESIRGVWGKPITFADKDIINRYLKVAGGDNGMYDDQILPEWKQGIIGPNGPFKIIDYATIDPADSKSVKSATYYLGGCVTTHSLRTTWMANAKEGAVWTNDGRIDPSAGHAIHCCGVNPAGNMVMTTWGMKVQLTDAGLANSQAEVIVVVALDWFDAKGYTPNGTHYNEIAEFWLTGTGRRLPVGLFPDPTPNPPPPPNPTQGITGVETLTYADGRLVNRTFTPGTAPTAFPNVDRDTHRIDLAPHLAHIHLDRRKERVRSRIIAAISDHDGVNVSVDGDEITLTRKAGFDPQKWLDFLTKLMPFILQLIALFGA